MSTRLEELLNKLEQEPQNTEVLCEIGKINKENGNFTTARQYFEKALEIDNNYCPATCCIINLLIDFGHYSEGFNILYELLRTHPENELYKATIFNALFAVFLLHKIQSETAVKNERHNYEELFFRIGRAFKYHKLYEPAIKIYEETCGISPANARMLLDLSECYIIKEQYIEAEKVLFDLKDRYPEDEDVLILLAELFFKQEEYRIARNYSEKLLEFNPEHINAKNILAKCCIKEKDYLEAIKIYKKQLETKENTLNSLWNLFVCNKMIGDDEQAAKYYDRIKEIDTELADLLEMEVNDYSDNLEEIIE